MLLAIYLQFLPIISVLVKKSIPQLSHIIFLIDKILIFSFFLVFIYVRSLGWLLSTGKQEVKKKFGFLTILKKELIFFIFLAFFCFWCFVSAIINQNSLKVTLFGCFAYIGYFLTFFVFSSIPYTKNLIRKNYIFLLRLALFFSAFSIFQEILALIYPNSVNWWPNIQGNKWRLGLFRAPSIFCHPNGIGIFALFFFIMELAKAKESGLRHNWLKLSILGLAIFFSVSRNAIGGAFIALFFLLPIFRKIFLASLPVIILCGILFFNQLGSIYFKTKFSKPDLYRRYTLKKSLNIFEDHPFFGVGPGMYGGHISIKYKSPVYASYGFSQRYLRSLYSRGSIEQQWVQVLAELGIFGLFFFIFLFLAPIFILVRLLKKEKDPFLKWFEIGLMIIPVVMIFYMLGFTVTQLRYWLFPYFAFVGMLVGSKRR